MKKVKLGTHNRFILPLPYTLTEEELNTHKHVMGVTGVGKSKLLAHLAASLIMQHLPVAVIDPHADLSQDILGLLCARGYFTHSENYQRFRYLDFTRPDAVVPLNILHQPYDPPTVARLFVEVCTRAWTSLADGNAPTFENILLKSIPVLIANQLPLTALERLLLDSAYREQLLANTSDPNIVSFFRHRYDKWRGEQTLMANAALNRAALLCYPPLNRIFGQKDNLLNFQKIMNEGISVVCNLGGLDRQTKRLLGCVLTVGFEKAAQSRAPPDAVRIPYQLIIDEFSDFCAQSEEALEDMLSQCRKFGLFLTLSHQTFSQVSSRLRGAIQNTMSIFFRLGYDDAQWAAPRIGSFDPTLVKDASSHLTEKDISTTPYFLEQYEYWTRELYEQLQPRQAYVKTNKSVKIQAVRVPETSTYRAQIDQIKDYYARRYLIPMVQLKQQEQQELVLQQSVVRRKRKVSPHMLSS